MAQERHENLIEQINILASKLGLPELTNSELDALYRLPPRTGKEPVVIFQFTSHFLREKWIQSRSHLRTEEPNLRFFDHLTPTDKKLLWLARTESEGKRYCFVWKKNGHVFLRISVGDNVVQISDKYDLEKICRIIRA